MTRAYDDSRYLARTLAASMLELEPEEKNGIVSFFQDELRRLGICDAKTSASPQQERSGQAVTPSGDHLNCGEESRAN